MRLTQLLSALAACAALMVQSAAAADVLDGVTFEELEAALNVGLVIESRTTPKGNKYLMARGKNHTIAAQLVHCGGQTRCTAVRYLSILKTVPSSSTINDFNSGPNYSKIAVNSGSGKAMISLDHHAGGGVTSENILQSAAMLMVGMTALGLSADIVASNKPTTMTLSFEGARQSEGLVKAPTGGTVTLAVDPAMGQAIAHVIDSAR